jgi:hypothetical protein
MKPSIRKAHRWLGLIFSITILMSSGSGVIHTIMSRSQAPPPATRPSGDGIDLAAIRLSAAEASSRIPGKPPISAINLRSIGGQPCYQLFTASSPAPIYVNAATGVVDPALDSVYAKEIASTFLGGKAVEKTDYLTRFNLEYIGIFRILPVYRFDANDGLGTRVYVSTITGSVTRLTDDQKQFEANLFTLIHKFGFIPNKDLRDWSLVIVTGGAFVLSLSGIVLFFLTRPRRRSMATATAG